MDLSIIIPSYKDPMLHKTIASIISNFTTDYEIIPVLDGYTPKTPIIDHPRVRPLHLKENRGMRNAINQGVKKATGKYLMRTDEHVMFAHKFDETILSTIRENQIVDATRYFLDIEKWEVMDLPPMNMEKLIIDESYPKFAAVRWKSADEKYKDVQILPKMAMQGSVWVMPHAWWDAVIKELDDVGYGTLYQDSTEMIMKTWQAGGELMLNKNTWYAHKHRSFNRTHSYPGELSRQSWDYALRLWGDYYRDVVVPKWNLC